MKKIFLLISLVLTLAATGSAQISVPVKKGGTLPATCSPSNIQTLLFYKTGSSDGLYYCSATNTWTAMASSATGNVVGPGSSTDNAIARFDGTTGELIQNSPVTIADTTGAIAGARSIALSGSTSGSVKLQTPAVAGTNTITLPAGTTDFSATGGTSQVVKQTTSGGAFTVAQLAASDLSNGTTGSGSVVLSTSPALTTPNLGTPSALTLTNATGLPVSGITASTSTALGVGSVELGNASDTTLSRASAGVLAVEGVTVPTTSSTNTLTNKRITLRTGTTTSSATPTINTDNVSYYSLTAQAAAITSFTTNLSGTPVEGDLLWISITDNGTARAITWGASFEASGNVALPATTVISTRLDVLFAWNSATSKWRCIAVA